jgi:hypothetical protein
MDGQAMLVMNTVVAEAGGQRGGIADQCQLIIKLFTPTYDKSCA